jgi:hypothetical protein
VPDDEECNFARWGDHPVERNEQGFFATSVQVTMLLQHCMH